MLAATDVATRDLRLRSLTRVLQLDPLPIDDRVAEAWATLRLAFRDAGTRMPINDSWIAATALAHGLALVTQDRDHLAIAGLEVVRV